MPHDRSPRKESLPNDVGAPLTDSALGLRDGVCADDHVFAGLPVDPARVVSGGLDPTRLR